MRRLLNNSFTKERAVVCSHLLDGSLYSINSQPLIYNKTFQSYVTCNIWQTHSIYFLATIKTTTTTTTCESVFGLLDVLKQLAVFTVLSQMYSVSNRFAPFREPLRLGRGGLLSLAQNTAEPGPSAAVVLDFLYFHTCMWVPFIWYCRHCLPPFITIKVAPFTVVSFTSLLNKRITWITLNKLNIK